MARKRSITSAMGTDARLGRIARKDPTSALIWPWLLTAFDDWGRMDVTEVSEIGLEVLASFPDRIRETALEKAIKAYVTAGLLHQYEAEGKVYLCIQPAKWMKWQVYLRGTKRASTASKNPAPIDPPWGMQEEADFLLWLTKPDERGQIKQNADKSECPQMSADVRRHSGLSVPSPSPYPYPSPSVILQPRINAREEDEPSEEDVRIAAERNQAISEVENAVTGIGMTFGYADGETANQLIAEYTQDWVLEAIRRAADAPASARCWRYIKKILKNWREKGGIDDVGGAGHGAAETGSGDGGNAYRRFSEGIVQL